MNTKKIHFSAAFIRLFLILMAVTSIFPMLFAFYTSFKNNQEFYSNIWALPRKFRISNYMEAVSVGHLGEYAANSIIIAALTLAITILLSVFAAYALSRLHVPGTEMILTILILIQILPTEAIIIPEYIIVSRIGLLHVKYWAMVLPYIAWMLPGDIIILVNFFNTIPMELIESARIDGATEMTTLRKIMVPLMKAPLCTCLIFNFCAVWGELMWARITTLTTDEGLPLTIGLLNFQGMYGTDWGVMTAAICVILIPLYIVFVFTQKYFVQGLTSGSVKG